MTEVCKRGGLRARLFFFLPAVLAGVHPAQAWEDLFQSVTGLDLDRQIWMPSDPCSGENLVDAIPGLAREDAECVSGPKPVGPPVSAAVTLNDEDLLRKTGGFAVAEGALSSGLALRLQPVAGLDIRSTLQRIRWDRRLGDTSLYVDPGGAAWESQTSISVPLIPRLVPYVAAGWNSEGGWENALALQGHAGFGVSWSLATGTEGTAFPVMLKLEDYRVLSVPFVLREDFHAASVGWKYGPLEAAWSGRLRVLNLPNTEGILYSLSDSGRVWENTASLAWADSGSRGHWRASGKWEQTYGEHVFRGIRSTDNLYQFGYEQGQNRDGDARIDVRAGKGPWESGGFAGISRLDWDAFRPQAAYGKYFWDRNGVLDSYAGNVLDLFDSQTWLFNGNLYLRQWTTGAWMARTTAHWRWKAGLDYSVVDLEAFGTLTKKNSEFLIGYTLDDYSQDFPGVRAQFMTPELGLTAHWGRTFVEASAAQAVPIRVEFRRLAGEGQITSGGSPSGSYSGGTRASLRMGWGVF